MKRLLTYWNAANAVGRENIPRRLLQIFRVRSGLLRKRLDTGNFSDDAFQQATGASAHEQPDLWHDRAKALLTPPSCDLWTKVTDRHTWEGHVIEPCGQALQGHYRFFSHWTAETGWPPDFNHDPVHGVRWATGRHWLEGPDTLGGKADIKFVWELSRLTLAFHLARAYQRDQDETWAQTLWALFDAWILQNPPQDSIAWACGQEMTFRLIAMLFAASATIDSPSATPQRLYALTRLAWQTARHITVNINHARSQKNNHAISEAVGLFTVGALFPELPEAPRWARQGLSVLAAEMRRQVYDDGSFVQHSLNYHRVTMDDLLWAQTVARATDKQLPGVATDRFARATRWLSQMIDPSSGRVPNYGPNDGASVLPLSCCDYTDYRPTLQAAWFAVNGQRCLEPGPWDEKMLWLFGPDGLSAPLAQPTRETTFAAPKGGYYILRGDDSWAMTRCHTYRDRPSQADMLHLDLWHDGVNILRDAGSYMYNGPEPWRSHFPSTAAHNTPEIDNQSQMTKGPRFLWFNWTRAKLLQLHTSPDRLITWLQAEHYGYRRIGVIHRRGICRLRDTYIITDDILGTGRHRLAIRWRLCPADWRQHASAFSAMPGGTPFTLSFSAPDRLQAQLISGQEQPTPEGWESLYYGLREPVPVVRIAGAVELPVRCVTMVAPGETPEVRHAGIPGQALRLAVNDTAFSRGLSETTGGSIRPV
jgi:hypothetical protein